MGSREEILEKCRRATAKSVCEEIGVVPSLSRFIKELNTGKIVEQFSEKFLAANGFIYSSPITDIKSLVLDLLQKKSIQKIAIRNSGILSEMNLAKFLEKNGIEAIDYTNLVLLELSGAGITSSDFGIASLGTIVEITARNVSRAVSLVPPVHISILERQKIIATLSELLLATKNISNKDSFTFITGPSRTADIEQILTLGVHGPKEVHLILTNRD